MNSGLYRFRFVARRFYGFSYHFGAGFVGLDGQRSVRVFQINVPTLDARYGVEVGRYRSDAVAAFDVGFKFKRVHS